MRCPIDETELRMTERQGVEIDYCPECRGVWLDRGELDKIIERSGREVEEAAAAPPRRDYDDRSDYRDYPRKPYKKKKNLLSELFDFD